MTIPLICPVKDCRNPIGTGVSIMGPAPERREMFVMPLCEAHSDLAMAMLGVPK